MAEQAALAEFIAEGHFSAHLKRTRTVYQERHDALHRELESRLGGLVSVTGGHAGLHLLYTFNQPLDDALLTSRALAEGLIIRPLSLYYLDQTAPRPPGMNLGYAAVPVERIGRPARSWREWWRSCWWRRRKGRGGGGEAMGEK